MVSRTLVSICDWMLGSEAAFNADPGDARDRRRTDAFFADLAFIANRIGTVTHVFGDPANNPQGYIQLHRAGGEVTIHRIWTSRPGEGHGSMILRKICELADRHGVVLRLKVTPLGSRPRPMTAAQLQTWYHRYGFEGEKKMKRLPRVLAHPPVAAAEPVGY